MTQIELESWGFALLTYLAGLVVCGVMALRERAKKAREEEGDG